MLVALTIVLAGCSVSPEKLYTEELDKIAADRISRVVTQQEPINGPIDLYEAMARALKYNLDYKVKLAEQALRSQELKNIRLDMLPKLVANAGYSSRDSDPGGSSRLIDAPFTESLRNSTSQEREHFTGDLTVSWNVLDFGLSYIRARQQSDEILIAMEQRRKVANRIIEDVRTAYWRAVSSQLLLAELGALETRVNDALENSAILEVNGNSSPMKALMYRRELMSIKLQIKALHRDFSVAKHQLAALMSIAPTQEFELVTTIENSRMPDIRNTGNNLIKVALRDRPELRELNYQMRINSRQTRAALLKLLPSLNFKAGYNFDTNKYLHDQNWASWGATVGWNLFNIARYPKEKEKAKSHQYLLDQRALAMSMAVMTQVHISLARYVLAQDELNANSEYLEIQNEILRLYSASRDTGRIGQQEWIREKMNTLVARAKHGLAYADLQNVYANIYASIGQDAFPLVVDGSESVEVLGAALREYWEDRQGMVNSDEDVQAQVKRDSGPIVLSGYLRTDFRGVQ
ncbi:hypothetical protein AB833_14935 [Chromatiales bacterium (ex Bugula neritina AB1)]|nr:hypothetical protein AB833_14935 [Chromatiales bacterium (ex Bugula neritina AB1)]